MIFRLGIYLGAVARWEREKPLYQSMITACKSTSEQGFFCYEEMFVWAK